jgi:NADPH2:quinone reductase
VESGAYAQVVYVPEGQAFVIPEEIPDTVAGSSICVGLTAWHLLRVAALKPGQTVLVHGGAGGVGSTLVQMCKKRSAKVITTVGSDEKAAFAQAMGADCVIDYGREEFSEKVLDFTDGCGVEVIFDCVGRVVTDGNFACLQNGGQIVYFGSASGHAQFPGDKVLNKAARITGFVIFNMFRSQVLWQQGVNGLLTVLMDGSIATRVKELPMADVVAAHKMLESRQVSGKLVLDMR